MSPNVHEYLKASDVFRIPSTTRDSVSRFGSDDRRPTFGHDACGYRRRTRNHARFALTVPPKQRTAFRDAMRHMLADAGCAPNSVRTLTKQYPHAFLGRRGTAVYCVVFSVDRSDMNAITRILLRVLSRTARPYLKSYGLLRVKKVFNQSALEWTPANERVVAWRRT